MELLFAAIVIGGIGAVAAMGLGAAARIFAVYVDPKVIEVEESLPGANCGGCGFTGCNAAACAVVKGKAPPSVCIVGGIETAEKVADLMGLTVTGGETGFAMMGCKHGIDTAHILFNYKGISDCRASNLVGGGYNDCKMGCLRLGTCVSACTFGALSLGENGIPVVDKSKCTACGACERICPRGIIKVQTPSRKFTHVQTSDDCTAPCQATCPAQIDIPAYIMAIGEGNYETAVTIIKESNPFPLVCGRVCPHVCESACRRNDVDEAVNINHLKRFAADYELHSGRRIVPQVLPYNGKRIAIVGAGPSGLTCAFYLARMGYQVMVYESMPKVGGMLRYGIPEYRLPKETLDWEIKGILDLGVGLECNKKMGEDFTLDSLINKDGYDAVYLAVGAWDSRRLGVDGEKDFPEVQSGTEFLIKRGLEEETPVGNNVIVVGGGNTAMDAARTSWRLGAKNVYLLYRRSRKEMPANDIEVEEGENEEIKYHFLAAPAGLHGAGGKLNSMEYIKMELGEPDASGRRRPVPIKGSNTKIEADNVFSAIGQSPDLTCLDNDELGKKLGRTRWNSIVSDDGTMLTDVPDVYTGGDCQRGAATAVEAIRDGRFAARAINLSLTGEEMQMPENWYSSAPSLPGVDKNVVLPKSDRVHMNELEVEERRLNFDEVELGLTAKMAKKESERCLQCGTICYNGYREDAS